MAMVKFNPRKTIEKLALLNCSFGGKIYHLLNVIWNEVAIVSTTVIDLLENFFNKMNGLKNDKENEISKEPLYMTWARLFFRGMFWSK